MHITRHVPSIFDSVVIKNTVQFETLDELLEIPFVKNFRLDPFAEQKPHKYFKRYSIADGVLGPHLLMVEYDKADDWNIGWWVIGRLSKEAAPQLDLPRWTPPEVIK